MGAQWCQLLLFWWQSGAMGEDVQTQHTPCSTLTWNNWLMKGNCFCWHFGAASACWCQPCVAWGAGAWEAWLFVSPLKLAAWSLNCTRDTWDKKRTCSFFNVTECAVTGLWLGETILFWCWREINSVQTRTLSVCFTQLCDLVIMLLHWGS